MMGFKQRRCSCGAREALLFEYVLLNKPHGNFLSSSSWELLQRTSPTAASSGAEPRFKPQHLSYSGIFRRRTALEAADRLKDWISICLFPVHTRLPVHAILP
jgi:hypothetical protein